MSRTDKKYKKTCTTGSGTHCMMIADLFYLKDATGKIIKNLVDQPTMVVIFKKDDGTQHEQHYTIDGNFKQENFNKMLDTAKVTPSEGRDHVTKKDAIGKRLWCSIKEIHHVMDDKQVTDEYGPVIEYSIFKASPFIEGLKRPMIAGDPQDNEGIASGQFINYINFASEKKIVNKIEPQTPVKVGFKKKVDPKATQVDLSDLSINTDDDF